MSIEESKQPTPETPPSPNKSRPVTVYLVILFAAALLLLLMSFFMQQRNNQALEDLNESMISHQDAAGLEMDLQRLEFELQQAEDQLAEAQETALQLEKEAEALEWLRQMEGAARSSYTELKTLVDQFEESGLADHLPSQSVVEGADSPAETYRDLYAMVY